MNWIAIHEKAAADYDEMAMEAASDTMRKVYEGLAAHRRQQAEYERRKCAELQAPTPDTTAVDTVEYEPLDEYRVTDWI